MPEGVERHDQRRAGIVRLGGADEDVERPGLVRGQGERREVAERPVAVDDHRGLAILHEGICAVVVAFLGNHAIRLKLGNEGQVVNESLVVELWLVILIQRPATEGT